MNRRNRHWWLVLIGFYISGACAGDWLDVYGRDRLRQDQPRFERRINELYLKGIRPVLSADEAAAFMRLRIEVPLVGEVSQDPTDFYSGARGGRPFVAMPVLSLLFLEDLCTAYAWLWANDYSFETIDEYVTMLRYRKPGDFPGGVYPSPLSALHIPDNALGDSKVDDLSLRFRNTAYAFILGHELGHILLRHRGYERGTKAQSRTHETDADTVALDVLERTDTLPMGAMLYFQMQAYLMPNKGQLKAEGVVRSERDWQRYLQAHLTHPLSANRLESMALHLNRWSGRDRSTAEYIATRLYQIAQILEIEELQGCMAVVGSRLDPAGLVPRRSRRGTGDLMLQWCQGS